MEHVCVGDAVGRRHKQAEWSISPRLPKFMGKMPLTALIVPCQNGAQRRARQAVPQLWALKSAPLASLADRRFPTEDPPANYTTMPLLSGSLAPPPRIEPFCSTCAAPLTQHAAGAWSRGPRFSLGERVQCPPNFRHLLASLRSRARCSTSSIPVLALLAGVVLKATVLGRPHANFARLQFKLLSSLS